MQAADEARRRDARHARRASRTAPERRSRMGARTGVPTAGTLKAGRGPKKIRPMNVAVPVASATGRNVRVLTSGIMSSMAKITPPIGVLKVAAMPAPAPAATSVMRCQASSRMNWPMLEPKRRADLNDRSLAPDGRTAADCQRRGERLHGRDHRPDAAFLVEDRVHDFRHAVPACLGRKCPDQENHPHAADDGDENDQRAPRRRRRVDVGVVDEREVTQEKQVVHDRDQRSKRIPPQIPSRRPPGRQ